MKLFIASDIHGSAYYCEKMIAEFKRQNCQKILLLGDILYHGPRNDLPAGYAPKKVIELLNAIKDDILCVRGNCEAEVDSMVLSFPVMADYAVLFLDRVMCYITHGHHIGEKEADTLPKGSVLINGHTHVYAARELECGVFYLNPGSVSLPKEGKEKTYMIYLDGVFSVISLETGEELLRADIRKWKDGN